MTYQHQLLVFLLQQAAVEELVQRDHIGEVESLAAQTFVGSAPKAQTHYGFALEKDGGISMKEEWKLSADCGKFNGVHLEKNVKEWKRKACLSKNS